MAEPRVIFDGVWKKFRRGERHDSLRDLIPASAKRLLGRARTDELEEQEFWALREVSFEVKPGQALGIIGPNGAGKSTALKLLTRILRPTRGQCELRGRVGALIEVAAGFHGDLTGRENIYLQGAIMGMKRSELRVRFDEIVDFSGIGDFIDTPVKRYSSGMNARLGFAIAAHVHPDVLIVDEVLAVGDIRFQRRAYDKIAEVKRDGAAVVVVSHQLERITDFCDEATLLDSGSVALRGTAQDVVAKYIEGSLVGIVGSGTYPVSLSNLRVSVVDCIQPGQRLSILLDIASTPDWAPERQVVAVRLLSATGEMLFATGIDRLGLHVDPGSNCTLQFDLTMNVNGGNYYVEAFVWDSLNSCIGLVGPHRQVTVERTMTMFGSIYLAPTGSVVQAGAELRTECPGPSLVRPAHSQPSPLPAGVRTKTGG